MVNTSVTYTSDGTTEWDVPFPYLSVTDLAVYVDGVSVDFTESTYGTIELDEAPANGATILIQRVTNIDERAVDFADGAALTADELDAQTSQLLYWAQEIESRIDSLSGGDGGDGGGGEAVPAPSALNRFLVSVSDGSSGYDWGIKTAAQVASILGVGDTVPTPVSGNRFLITNVSSATYQLATIAEIQSILGISAYSLPNPLNRANQVVMTNASGTAYDLVTPTNLRNQMGLGNAALLNVGTAVGNIPQLITSGSGAALPAVYGGLLTGIGKQLEYAQFQRVGENNSEYVGAGVGNQTTWGRSISNNLAAVVAPTGSSWATLDGSGNIVLTQGRYWIVTETMLTTHSGSGSDTWARANSRIRFSAGTVTPSSTLEGMEQVATNNTSSSGKDRRWMRAEGLFIVSSTTGTFLVETAQASEGGFTAIGIHARTGIVSTRVHIWRIG